MICCDTTICWIFFATWSTVPPPSTQTQPSRVVSFSAIEIILELFFAADDQPEMLVLRHLRDGKFAAWRRRRDSEFQDAARRAGGLRPEQAESFQGDGVHAQSRARPA